MKRLETTLNLLGPEVIWYFLFSIVAGVLWFLVESGFVYILQGFLIAFDIIEKKQTFLPDWYPRGAQWAIGLLVGYGIARGIIYGLKVYISAACQQIFIRNQRTKIVHFMFSFLERLKSHELISIFNERVNNSGFLLMSASSCVNTTVSSLLFLISGFFVAPKEQILALILSLTMVTPLKLINKRITDAGNSFSTKWNFINEEIMKGVRNYTFLKIHGINKEKARAIEQSIFEYFNFYKRYLLSYSFKKSLPLISGIIILSITSLVSRLYLHTEGMKLLAFFYIFIRFAQSTSELLGSFSEVSVHQFSFRELYLLQQKMSKYRSAFPDQPVNQRIFFETKLEIALKNISFSYAKSQPNILTDFNLVIKSGDFVVIKGGSGSGKSTLLYLLLGILKPNSGTILINGTQIEGLWIDSIPGFGYVGPEPFILEGTVRENLLYGSKLKATDNECWSALEKAELRADISRFEKGLEERLYETTQLSTGQKQRLAIARAFLRQPHLLILDEATANLDLATEERIISRITGIQKNMVCIVVTHKQSFDRFATQNLQF